MKNGLLTLLAVLVATVSQAQKVKIKKGTVLVDDVEYAQWTKDDIVPLNRNVKNTNGDVLLVAVLKSYTDPAEVSQSNPKGTVSYYEITEPESGGVYFEFQGFPKQLFKSLYNGKAINDDGSLNMQNLKKIATRYGHEFSRKRGERPQIIIIKD